VSRAQQPAGTVVLSVNGELDMMTAPDFEKRLYEAISVGVPHVVIDFTDCTFIDSSGLHILVRACRHHTERISLIIPHDSVTRRVFELAKLDRALPISPEIGPPSAA
jgi:anti-sigma B factor antagonist